METNQITTSQNKDQVSDEMMKTIEIYTESQDEFPVDFDQFWQWCGFARKDSAKRTLEKNFEEGGDYILHKLVDNKQISKSNPQLIHLTNDCAKAFVIMAGTTKGKEIRKYIGMNNCSPLIFNP